MLPDPQSFVVIHFTGHWEDMGVWLVYCCRSAEPVARRMEGEEEEEGGWGGRSRRGTRAAWTVPIW